MKQARVVVGRRGPLPIGVMAAVRAEATAAPASALRSAARSRRPVRLSRRSEPFLLMAGASALIALLATLYLTEANKAALMTYQINEAQREQTALLTTQGDLTLQLHQVESLQRIQAQAQALGMVPVNPNAVVYVDLPTALVTVSPSAPIAEAGQ